MIFVKPNSEHEAVNILYKSSGLTRILGGGTEIYPYKVEGIGYDFFPDVLDNTLIDKYIKVNDEDSFNTAKKLIKEEGLLIGGSSGTAMYAAIKAAIKLNENQNCLVILPDSIRNYLSKFVDDKWMEKIVSRKNNLVEYNHKTILYTIRRLYKTNSKITLYKCI